MRKQFQGIAIILLSILFCIAFDSMGVRYLFDLSISWSMIFLLAGIVGAVMVFLKPKNGGKDE